LTARGGAAQARPAPPPDFSISPYTGLTRQHWEHWCDRLLSAARGYAGPGNSLVLLPGLRSRHGERSDALEGFARTFLMAAFRLAGSPMEDPDGLTEWYAEGLATGTDPASPGYWPPPGILGQAKVEAASIALALSMTRPRLWDRLDSPVQERVIAWLATVVGQDYPPVNWVWFRVVVEDFLRSVGGPYSQSDIGADLALHESFVRSGGWCADGAERAFDHYSGWVLQLYPLLWSVLSDSAVAQARRPVYAARYRDYVREAVLLQGADGSPLIQGRSLIYRFAAAAPLWAGAYTGSSPLHPGQVRRAASGMLGHFLGHGVPDARGLLTVGWHQPWEAMAQSYSGAGSPYWAATGMLGLALPAGHAVWTSTEQPLPVEEGDFQRTLRAPGWLVSGTRRDGIVRIANHGTDHAVPGEWRTDDPLYARLGYSTATFPALVGGEVESPGEQSVVLVNAAGSASHRTGFQTLFLGEAGPAVVGISRFRAHWPSGAGGLELGPWVLVASLLRGDTEIRLVRVDVPGPDEAPATVQGSQLRVGGWPLSGPGAGPDGAGGCSVGGLVSTVANLRGLPVAGCTELGEVTPLGPDTAYPWAGTSAAPVPGEVHACAMRLAGTGSGSAAGGAGAKIAVGHQGMVTVLWDDGGTSAVPFDSPHLPA
jgi:hypothetical protein